MWAVLLCTAFCTLTVSAATLTVTNPVDGAPGSLRAQVAAASAGDTIDFAAAGDLQLLLLGDILIDKELVFIGNGLGTTVVDGSALNRIFTIDNANQVYITGISFTNGSATDVGGAISIDSTDVTIDGSEVANSVASGAAATQGGGGIYNNAGMLTIQNSLLDNNDATGTSGSGGAILNSGGGMVMVMNSTISNNTSQRAGGGI